MKFTDLSSAEKISIAGYGAEGKAAEKFCRTHFPDMFVEIIDPISDLVSDEGSMWIVSPGIPRKHFSHIPAKRVTSGTEIFFDSLEEEERARVIGISGTKGKSTTTKFCMEALNTAGKKAVAAGNYGVPLLEVFDDFKNGTIDYVVAELSSYQLENLRTSPGIAIFLNLFPDHLDRHGSFVSYQEAKSNLFLHQKKGDILISPKTYSGSFDVVSNVYRTEPLSLELFPENSSFRANHWRQNFGVLPKLFELLDLSSEIVAKTAQKFSGLPHRLQHFSSFANRLWWDDSICTNPEAAVATVQFFGKKLGALIVGGQDRGMDVSLLAEAISKYAPEALMFVLESESAERFVAAIPSAVRVSGFESAVSQIMSQMPEGLNAVLCPAAPSYDSFKNFKEKGDAWQAAVSQLK